MKQKETVNGELILFVIIAAFILGIIVGTNTNFKIPDPAKTKAELFCESKGLIYNGEYKPSFTKPDYVISCKKEFPKCEVTQTCNIEKFKQVIYQ